MRVLNPDTLKESGADELLERQARTGEIGNGLSVYCCPDPVENPGVWQMQHRTTCLFRPYVACVSCPHRHFQLVFEEEQLDDWVLCPRWSKNNVPFGGPDFYTPVPVSECRDKPHPFCRSCPGREELVQLSTDKKRNGWLERYKKLTREDE